MNFLRVVLWLSVMVVAGLLLLAALLSVVGLFEFFLGCYFEPWYTCTSGTSEVGLRQLRYWLSMLFLCRLYVAWLFVCCLVASLLLI
jgi:hypothetical protein